METDQYGENSEMRRIGEKPMKASGTGSSLAGAGPTAGPGLTGACGSATDEPGRTAALTNFMINDHKALRKAWYNYLHGWLDALDDYF